MARNLNVAMRSAATDGAGQSKMDFRSNEADWTVEGIEPVISTGSVSRAVRLPFVDATDLWPQELRRTP
jgi:hypothetical protein